MNQEIREKIQSEALSKLLSSNGTAKVPMRTGKTLIGLKLARKFNKVLVGYPNVPVLEGWLKDSKSFDIDISHITFTTYKSLKKYDLKSFDLVILDEIDCVSSNNWLQIVKQKPIKLNGLTGTPPESGDKAWFYKNYCPTIFEVPLEETSGTVHKDYSITVHMVPVNKQKNVRLSSGKMWSEYDKINYYNSNYLSTRVFRFMLALIRAIGTSESKFKYLDKLLKTELKDQQVLVFAYDIKNAEMLCENSYHSKNPDSEKSLELFKSNQIKHLSSVGQIKAGVTLPNVHVAVVQHSYASASQASQKLARAMTMLSDNPELKAELHVICLDGTSDVQWVEKGLKYFEKSKITYKTVTL